MLLDFHLWHGSRRTAGSTCVHIQLTSAQGCGTRRSRGWHDTHTRHKHTTHTQSFSLPLFFSFLFSPNLSLILQSPSSTYICSRNTYTHTTSSTHDHIYSFSYCSIDKYCKYTQSPFSVSLFLQYFLPLPVSTLPPFPGWPYLRTRAVMMRNGVIMSVVKPQAAQQMCFWDLAFVSEGIRPLLW